MTDASIAPCPFDGGTPDAVELWDAIARFAAARPLSVQRQVAVAEISSIIRSAWNRRAATAETEALRSALRECRPLLTGSRATDEYAAELLSRIDTLLTPEPKP